jgi:hypothetical protein
MATKEGEILVEGSGSCLEGSGLGNFAKKYTSMLRESSFHHSFEMEHEGDSLR